MQPVALYGSVMITISLIYFYMVFKCYSLPLDLVMVLVVRGWYLKVFADMKCIVKRCRIFEYNERKLIWQYFKLFVKELGKLP